ncbi:MAG: orotate phosphoribosyltransferase [Candidatus Aenigmarchaeota archaeon]|nr:orotate phosphoribosyltransferase [Candidatus Aenigmarchaeota archaeon]
MVSALCAICGKPTKHPHSCRFCGAIVCEEHYDPSTGLCVLCRSKFRRVEFKK